MRTRILFAFVLGFVASGCSKKKSTDELVVDLNSSQEKDRLIAVRTLPLHKGDEAKVVPALIGALKDKENDIRWSAAIGLGNLGEGAKEAIPALVVAQRDKDARVREAAGVALTRIDPQKYPAKK